MKQPFLFLVGTDHFQIDLLIDEKRKEIFPNGSGGMNDDIFDANERSLAELFDMANTLPMFASERLIVVRNAGTPNEAELAKWLAYLENPSPHTHLVATSEKIDKRLKFAKTLEKLGYLKEVQTPKPHDLPDWIRRLSARHGVSVQPRASAVLSEAVGTDLGRLNQEIEKLSLYVHPEKVITEKAVSELVLNVSGDNVFAWTDQIFEGNLRDALTTLHHLLEEGQPPLVLASMLARHLRILMKAHPHTSTRGSSNLAPRLGVPPFLVERYLTQAKRLKAQTLRRTLDELSRLDHDLKSTGHPPHLLLERSTRTIALGCQ